MKASGFISPKIPCFSMHLGLLHGKVRTEHFPECLSIVDLAQQIHMMCERKRVDLPVYVSIVVASAGWGSATYPDDQRRFGFVGKDSIRCHCVFYTIWCSNVDEEI